MNAVTHIARPEMSAEQTLFAQRRAAIDLIATTRAKAIRAALFANHLFRNHPIKPEDETTRQGWRDTMQSQIDDMTQVCNLLNGVDPSGDVLPENAEWIGKLGALNPEKASAFEKMRALTQTLLNCAKSDDIAAFQHAVEAQLNFGHNGFFELVGSFCEILWSDLDETRRKEVEQANATGAAITKTLRRLEHIGKHVRLVSLNASVEAARVGDAGRGLGVIAVEFKTLAEEIQQLATSARADVTALERHSDPLTKM